MGGREGQENKPAGGGDVIPQLVQSRLALGDKLGPALDSLDWALNPQPPIPGAQILTHYTLFYSSSGH